MFGDTNKKYHPTPYAFKRRKKEVEDTLETRNLSVARPTK
jgi:hypothetical protein